MSDQQWLLAPAKLTLSLRIEGVRGDGYHNLAAEMVSIDLADELLVDPTGDWLEVIDSSRTEPPSAPRSGRAAASKGSGVRGSSTKSPDLTGESSDLSTGPDNLVKRALGAIGRSAGVRLFKRVPVGGGLGGGSSDAAAMLRWGGCSDLEIAARLGADVPFCLHGGRALVGGIGEKVVPLPFEERSFVLLVPPFPMSTAEVYRAWDSLPTAERGGGGEAGNDLLQAALAIEPRLARWRDLFASLTGRPPRLAGSGSTWFVEGSLADVGLERRRMIGLDGAIGLVIPVKAVPAGWTGPAQTD